MPILNSHAWQCACALALTVLVLLAPSATAADEANYPSRALRFIVPNPPGGGTDLVARIAAQAVSARLGQNLVIDNRAGAGGAIAAGVAARAAPDGYTLLLGHFPLAMMAATSAGNSAFDPQKEFAPIVLLASTPNALAIKATLAARSVREFIALAKSQPGQLRYASGGNATSMHVSAELFNLQAGTQMLHVPYKGAAPALVELIAGEVDASFVSLPSALAHIKTGKIRALAVTGAKRSQVAPELPTIAEAGLAGYRAEQWYGVLAPRATPSNIIQRLSREFTAALTDSTTRARLHAAGFDISDDFSAASFGRMLADEIVRWRRVAQAAGIRNE